LGTKISLDGQEPALGLVRGVTPAVLAVRRQVQIDEGAWPKTGEVMVGYDELANVLGNLASRVVSMIEKYRGGVVPDAPADGLDEALREAMSTARSSMESLKVHEALAAAMDLARTANGYVEERQPWTQAKEAPEELDRTLATLTRALTALCALFEPVAPAKMADLACRLGLQSVPRLDVALAMGVAGRAVSKGSPLFPRVEPSWTK
jgi:methionyl-tRNA synthetase